MHLHLRGKHIPEAQFEVLTAITDHAGLRPIEVVFEEMSGAVRLPIVRYPLIRRRRVRGDLHDRSNPIPSMLTIRNVVSCTIADHTAVESVGQIHVLFGVRVRANEVYLCSAEEDRGSSCYSLTIDISGVDIELSDDPGSSADR